MQKANSEDELDLIPMKECEDSLKSDAEIKTELFSAIRAGDSEKVQSIFEQYGEWFANVFGDAMTHYNTPLLFAIDCGNAEIVKILLDNGADPYLRIAGKCEQYAKSVSPLALAKRKAAQEGDDKIMELIKEACKKKDLEYANEVCGTLSSSNDREFIMDYIRSNIIDCDADINMRDANGNTPLLALLKKYYMVICNSADCRELELLLETGANPNVCNNAGWTPLTEIIWTSEASIDPCNCYHGFGADCTQVVKLLLEHGADFSYATCADFEKASVVMQLLKENRPENYLQGVVELLRDKYGLKAE